MISIPAQLTIRHTETHYYFHLQLPAPGAVELLASTPLSRETSDQLMQAVQAAAEQLATWHGSSRRQAGKDALSERLRTLGGLLHDHLLPAEVQAALRQLPIDLPVVLATDESYLPWELLHDAGEPLLLRRPVSRRLLSAVPPRLVGGGRGQRNALIIANPTGDLPEADAELDRLLKLFDDANIPAKAMARQLATVSQVREHLNKGVFDFIHYSGHARPGALQLHDGDLGADDIQRILRGAPFVFLNGCASAREMSDGAAGGPGAGALGGQVLNRELNGMKDARFLVGEGAQGLAKGFLLGGATAFVGTLWPVLDQGSRQMAEWFYEQLLQGESVGQALYQVRQRSFTRFPSDPAWASYLHYGEPGRQLLAVERSEKRNVTILIARVSGLAALYAAVGLESAAPLVANLWDGLKAIATHYGGEVRGPVHHQLEIHFGLPRAYEDYAARAVKSALEMTKMLQGLLERQRARPLPPIAYQMGIASGRVLSREVAESQGTVYQIMGEVVDVAAELAEKAQAGELLLDAATHHLLRDAFSCERVAALADSAHDSSEARSAAEAVYRVVMAREEPSLREGRMIGREIEVGKLFAWWQEARAGKCQLVEIVGSPGMGKSYLVANLRNTLTRASQNGEGYNWIELHAHSYENTSAYALLGQFIRHLAQIHGGDDETSRRQKLATLVGSVVNQGGSRGAELMDEGLSLLGQPLGLPHPAPQLEQLGAKLRQRQLAALLQGLLTRTAQAKPAVLVLEDLQWSDEASLAVWQEILRGVSKLPLLILLVFRPGWSPPWSTTLTAQRLPLHELDAQEQGWLIADLLAQSSSPPGLNEQLIAWSAGNPFFLREAIILLQESKRLIRDGDQWRFVRIGNEAAPPTIEALVRARLDHLNPAERDTLTHAAVIGQEFARTLLEEVEPEMNRAVIDATLDKLIQRDLIEAKPSLWGSDTLYTFRHGIIHHTVYTRLVDMARRPLHRKVAQAVTALYGDGDDQVETLAFHYYHSDDWGMAAHFSRRAAQRAAAAYANLDAIEWYDRALQSLDRLLANPPDRMRLALGEEGIKRGRIEALEGKADVYATLGQGENAIQGYEQVLSLENASSQPAQRLAELHRKIGQVLESMGKLQEAANALQQGQDLLQGAPGLIAGSLYVWQGLVAFRQAKYDHAIPLCDQGIRLIEPFDDPKELARALNLRGVLHRSQSQQEEALAAYARSQTLYEKAADLPGLTRVLNNRGIVYQDQGRWDEALDVYQRGAELAVRTGEARWQASILVNQAEIYRRRGDFAKALEITAQALAMSKPIKLEGLVGLCHMNIAAVYLRQGLAAQAREHIDIADAIFYSQNDRENRCELWCYLAELFLAQGQIADAMGQAQAALALANEVAQPLALGQANRMVGQAHQAAGHTGVAHDLYLLSLDYVKQLPAELGVTLLRLAECCFQQSCQSAAGLDEGKSPALFLEEAGHFCRRAIETLAAVGAQLELDAARALAGQIHAQAAL